MSIPDVIATVYFCYRDPTKGPGRRVATDNGKYWAPSQKRTSGQAHSLHCSRYAVNLVGFTAPQPVQQPRLSIEILQQPKVEFGTVYRREEALAIGLQAKAAILETAA